MLTPWAGVSDDRAAVGGVEGDAADPGGAPVVTTSELRQHQAAGCEPAGVLQAARGRCAVRSGGRRRAAPLETPPGRLPGQPPVRSSCWTGVRPRRRRRPARQARPSRPRSGSRPSGRGQVASAFVVLREVSWLVVASLQRARTPEMLSTDLARIRARAGDRVVRRDSGAVQCGIVPVPCWHQGRQTSVPGEHGHRVLAPGGDVPPTQRRAMLSGERRRGLCRTIVDEQRRKDALLLVDLMSDVTGEPAVMWGTSITGFASRHYKYESGREGDVASSPTSSETVKRPSRMARPKTSPRRGLRRPSRAICPRTARILGGCGNRTGRAPLPVGEPRHVCRGSGGCAGPGCGWLVRSERVEVTA